MFNILIISRWCLHLKRLGLKFFETLRKNRLHFSGKMAKMRRRAVGNDHKLLSRYHVFYEWGFFLFSFLSFVLLWAKSSVPSLSLSISRFRLCFVENVGRKNLRKKSLNVSFHLLSRNVLILFYRHLFFFLLSLYRKLMRWLGSVDGIFWNLL